MITAISCIVGIIGTLCASLFGYLAYRARCDNARHDSGKKDGAVLTELGYIKSGVDDIKRKQEIQEERNIEILTRLSSVEESCKSAHRRIDTLL